jgi:hypothetical protein
VMRCNGGATFTPLVRKVPRMRIKLLFLIVVFLTFVTGAPAQSRSGDEQKAAVDSQEDSAPKQDGITILSDTQGVDFKPYLAGLKKTTQKTWEKLIPREVKAPTLRRGAVMIRFKILPNGQIMPGSMVLEGRSGSTPLDRAAWFALTGSKYPPLPNEFQGPFLELRTVFSYN